MEEVLGPRLGLGRLRDRRVGCFPTKPTFPLAAGGEEKAIIDDVSHSTTREHEGKGEITCRVRVSTVPSPACCCSCSMLLRSSSSVDLVVSDELMEN
jgi:hypothetical protein